MRFQEEGRKWRLPALLYADDLVLCGESEEGLREIAVRFIEVCRRTGLKVNSGVVTSFTTNRASLSRLLGNFTSIS